MKDERKPPDGGWGWMAVLGSALAHFLVVGLGRSFGLFYTTIKDNYQTTAAAAAWTVSLYNTIRMSGGIGGSLIFAPSYIIVGKYFDKKKGKAMSFATLGSGLGGVGLAPIITVCLAEYGYFGAMLIMGSLMLNNCVAASLYRPLPVSKAGEGDIETEMKLVTQDSHPASNDIEYKTSVSGSQIITDDAEAVIRDVDSAKYDAEAANHDVDPTKENLIYADKSSSQKHNSNLDLHHLKTEPSCCSKIRTFMRTHFSVMGNPRFLLYFAQIASMAICIQCVLTFLPDLGILRGFGNSLSALLLSIVGGADMLGRFITGFIFDLKFIRPRRRMVHSIMGMTFGGISMLFGYCQTYVHLVIVCVAWGIVEGGFHSQRATVVSEFTSKEAATGAISFTIAAQGIGNLVGPPVAGLLRDLSGDYVYTYLFSGAPHVIMTSLFLLEYIYSHAKTKKKQDQPGKDTVTA